MSKRLRGDYSLKQIDELYKSCKSITLKTRLLAIKLVYSGWKVTEIAEHLSVSYKTIYNWIDLWNKGEMKKLSPQVRGKRKKAYINKKEWLVILEEIKGKGYNLLQVRDYVEKTRGIKYTYKGIWNILRRWLKVPYGKPYVLIGKQSPTASEELKKKIDDALEKVGQEEVILGLLDESSVADCTGKSRVINTPKIKTINTYRSKRLFSYFGCLFLEGKSRVKATEKCKKEDLLEFFQELRKSNPEKNLIIILDNAKIHKAKIIQKFCQENKIILVYLPPYSPNLNPIEFMWKDLKKRLSEYYQENVENLKMIGSIISQELLELRQLSYTAKWREKFL